VKNFDPSQAYHQVESNQESAYQENSYSYAGNSSLDTPEFAQLVPGSSPLLSINEIGSTLDPFCTLLKDLKWDGQQFLQFCETVKVPLTKLD
jgi:hypothetical protein